MSLETATMYVPLDANLPLRIALVSCCSPRHPALTNPLATQTLKGDLTGEFGDAVTIGLFSVGTKAAAVAIAGQLAAFGPALVGLSIQPGSLNVVDSLMEAAWESPILRDALYVLGNQLPTYFPEQMLTRYPNVNSIAVRGEGELPLRAIVRCVLASRRDFRHIAGVVGRDPGSVVHLGPGVPTSLCDLPYPPSADGLTAVAAAEGFALIEASRGCSYGQCVYCTRRSFRFGKGWEPFAVERVLQNVGQVLDAGVLRAEFVDDEFFGGRNQDTCERAEQIADGVARIGRDSGRLFAFGVMTSPHVLHRPDDPGGNARIVRCLERLRAAGLVKVYTQLCPYIQSPSAGPGVGL